MIINQFFKLTLLFIVAFTCGVFIQDSIADSNTARLMTTQHKFEKTSTSAAASLVFSEDTNQVNLNFVYTPASNLIQPKLEWKIVRNKNTVFHINQNLSDVTAGTKYIEKFNYSKANLEPDDLIVAHMWTTNKSGEKIGVIKNYRYQSKISKAAGSNKETPKFKLPKKVFF